ncbi:MAG: type IV pilus biogenesis/stability protein PilW [Candidatus Muproteobacteria bacterium RBG_16_62_13]|uniref:Type IV pilus biogenesis/stability protein PilW n=1 Tax=Candidatus Muproteobacteria bacterium RBG_16_62_13 TaxID=1817756 RepID=A0A1F6SXD8_9PROT|nr:MAG: type IV pilus biogenesis/stability protein PilW [Candidatus Muproteobacteria bacterium RBG_16_62_13]
MQLGAHYLVRGQLDIAKQHIDRALEIDPDSSAAMDRAALLYWRLRDYKLSEDYFRRAIKTDARNFAAYHNYGAFLCDRGRYDEGVLTLEKAANNLLYPYVADANVNAGVCMLRKPSVSLAEKYFREALRLNPGHTGALQQMALISYRRGQMLTARAFIQRYFKSGAHLDTPEILLLAYRVETALRDNNAAASYALRLRSKFPDADEVQQLRVKSPAKRRK